MRSNDAHEGRLEGKTVPEVDTKVDVFGVGGKFLNVVHEGRVRVNPGREQLLEANPAQEMVNTDYCRDCEIMMSCAMVLHLLFKEDIPLV